MKNKIENKKKVYLLIVVLVVLFVGWKIGQKLFLSSGGPRGFGTAVAVEVAPIRKGAIREIAQHTATLEAHSRVIIAPKVAGRLNHLLVNIGDRVQSGQLIAQLEDEEYRQQVIQAEADLSVAIANLKEAESGMQIAEKNLERARALHQSGIQSDAQLDQVLSQYQAQEARFNVARAQVENRRAALENARLRLSYTQIRASWSPADRIRYVGERFVDPGALLAVNTPILSLIELNPIIAVIYVTDEQYFRLKFGQPALISNNVFSGRSFSGKVARIAPQLQETSRQARVEIEIDNRELLLKPGMFVNVEIEFQQKKNITVVPFNALVKRDDLPGIFIADLEKQVAHFVPVKVGISNSREVEIIEPANLSGYVVTLGHHLLENEGKIILPEGDNSSSRRAVKK